MGVTISRCTTSTELHRQYSGQHEAQPVYIELDLESETLHASYNAEVGNAVPFSVRHGFERRYTIPVLTGEAANQLMEQLVPLANRVVADWEKHWDGNNFVAHLGEDAVAAEQELEELISADAMDYSPDSVVAEWDIDGATNGCEAEEWGITADTTDARLDEIEAKILADLAECGERAVAVCDGLNSYLRGLREEFREDQDA
ncbi:hypothetical protein OG330_31015 (plasmid) [Streptomyces albidoflavus]|uniref:Uncharacterized protein n=1 Tax=Streptomyces albidoflavus TaxID=1886 RepID=A0A8G2E1V3_9ACTN|nr:hypothetical protein [Streptomyces albidoflavus]RZE15483.1 hypothetical protein C0Q92_31040 [Streptomyces albidoflavus]WSU19606.1 hypothetical protein OG330_31015 [Streptomyces albidoflavus]WTC33766.1 hypothetical protein OH749_31135 [Streptomyces albidoflavus]CAI4198577.1 hypothetical protein CCOS2040_31220 [Streptomyces albidoflavus]